MTRRRVRFGAAAERRDVLRARGGGEGRRYTAKTRLLPPEPLSWDPRLLVPRGCSLAPPAPPRRGCARATPPRRCWRGQAGKGWKWSVGGASPLARDVQVNHVAGIVLHAGLPLWGQRKQEERGPKLGHHELAHCEQHLCTHAFVCVHSYFWERLLTTILVW